jgi:N,N'-diacetyllegionaminate synthase
MKIRILAEAAQGYEGKIDYCMAYVDAAARAKADAIKFQIVYADDICEPGHVHYEIFSSLEMPTQSWARVKQAADDKSIPFVAEIFGGQSLKVAQEIKPDWIKIHSTDFFNRRLIADAFSIAQSVFVSAGGVTGDEIEALIEDVKNLGAVDRLILLYGYQSEPTPIEKSGLAKIPMLRRRFPEIELGYLDHTEGGSDDVVHVSAMAMALGVQWIEKHLTLSRFLEVEDFVSALEPDEFARYVETMHRLSTAFGRSNLSLTDEEKTYRDKAMKKILTARALKSGDEISADDIALIRSPRIPAGTGFHDPASVIGRRLLRDFGAGEPLYPEGLE